MNDTPKEFGDEQLKKLTAAQEEALEAARQTPVSYTSPNEEELARREAGEDFMGNLTEFQLTFEWVWDDPENKILVEKSNQQKFTGWIHIKDERLDEKTYPGQEQKIKFDEGIYQFVESLDADEGANE